MAAHPNLDQGGKVIHSLVYLCKPKMSPRSFKMRVLGSCVVAERKQFMSIVEWVDGQHAPCDDRAAGTLYELWHTRSA